MNIKSILSVVSVLLVPKKPKVLILFSIAVLSLFIHPTKSTAQTAINGSLETIGGHTVLNLWGTNYEMGYAHGFLMASKIRDVVDDYIVGRLVGGNVEGYNNFLSLESQHVTHYPEYLDEINGIAAGMAASGENLFVPALERDIDTRDIKAMNLIIELTRHCQSFGVWQSATATGETIMARNLEFASDTQGTIVNNQILITYEPLNGVKFVGITAPGLYSVMSGFNEHGVSVMANAVDGGESTSFGPFHPSTEVFRKILEATTPENYLTQPLAIVDSVEELVPFNIQIGAPQNESGTTVYYLEDSSGQNVIRYASDSNPGYNHIIGTNHFLNVIDPPPALDRSLTIYDRIESELISLYENGDGKVDSGEAWSILGQVGGNDTLTSIVIRPDSMQFDVSFSSVVDGIMTIAPSFQPQTYLWSNLFPNHSSSSPPPVPLPDLFILSVVANPESQVAGQPVEVTVTVRNQGTVASGDFSLDFYSNQASAPTVNQVGDMSCLKNGLAAGSTDTCTFTVSYPTAGNYNMWAQADSLQQVEELNEANNILGQTITVSEPQLPTATVTQPVNGAIFAQGETLNFAGDGTDPEDGILPASAFKWTAVGNVQTYLLGTDIKSGGVTITPDIDPGDYQIVLEVVDSQGSIDTDQVTITVSQ